MELIRLSFGKDRFHQQREMFDWCETHLGAGGYFAFTRDPENARWSAESMFGSTHFFFKEEKDAVLFGLIWRQY